MDEYFKDKALMILYHENFLLYDDPAEPLRARASWSSSLIDTKNVKVDIYGVKLDTFESYDKRISFSGNKSKKSF